VHEQLRRVRARNDHSPHHVIGHLMLHVEPPPRVIAARSIPGVRPLSTRGLQHALERRRFWDNASPAEIIRADERERRNKLWAIGGAVAGSWGGRMACYAAFSPRKVGGCLRYGFVESASDAASYPDRTGHGHVFVQAN